MNSEEFAELNKGFKGKKPKVMAQEKFEESEGEDDQVEQESLEDEEGEMEMSDDDEEEESLMEEDD